MNTEPEYPPTTWRLLDTGLSDGATNMAIDEAVLEAVGAGAVPPTLRFFCWSPPCLSLGTNQPIKDIDRDACNRRGWDIVRRLTGGSAVLHVDEFTYSVCVPEKEPRVSGGIVESYSRLVVGLLAGLKMLGLEPAEAKPEYPSLNNSHGPVCFEGPARYEITVDGRKLVGSAQARRKGLVLQHGTLPLEGDITRILDALHHENGADMDNARRHLSGRALTLETALGKRISFNQAARVMVEGFGQALNLVLEPGELTPQERKDAERIRAEKYANNEWTYKK
ncbi:MAG: lipoate--protein ligase family protein [Anaerolineales bacterium]|nr:lipoate--protein ligase family protein [Anaerolineales bacterium]